MPPLPPLPPLSAWKAIWPRPMLQHSMDKTNRNFRGRILLANPKLTNDFVRALKLNEGDVVVEAFPGPGQLTRSLLNGGNDTGADAHANTEGAEMGGEKKEWPRPKLVVTCEPSPDVLVTGMGMKEEQKPGVLQPAGPGPDARFVAKDYAVYESTVFPTSDPRLIISPSTPYRWPTLPQLLSHELVTPHLPVYDPTAPPGVEATKRPWNAPKPGITVVSQMPDSVAGDQMIAQWIGSAVGDKGKRGHSWIWEWGRVRLALLVGKNQYDRLLAGPREKIFCKLSVMARALFHISALPPYHHVFNVDKASRRTESTGLALGRASRKVTDPPPPDPYPRTTTYPDDFYPVPRGMTKHTDVPLPRPLMLGILLEPRLDSPIHAGNKDEWDYVLRKCFVTEAQTIQHSLNNLAFGAGELIEKISGEPEGGRYAGRPVDKDKVTRDLDVDDWARVVDVFAKWPFKPENLIMDSTPDEENRSIGQDTG